MSTDDHFGPGDAWRLQQAIADNAARLARHEHLLAVWRGLSADELLTDLLVLAQLAAFAQRQELRAALVRAAEAEAREGGGA